MAEPLEGITDAMAERARIVAWLRGPHVYSSPNAIWQRKELADAIERGEHDFVDLPRIKLGRVGD